MVWSMILASGSVGWSHQECRGEGSNTSQDVFPWKHICLELLRWLNVRVCNYRGAQWLPSLSTLPVATLSIHSLSGYPLYLLSQWLPSLPTLPVATLSIHYFSLMHGYTETGKTTTQTCTDASVSLVGWQLKEVGWEFAATNMNNNWRQGKAKESTQGSQPISIKSWAVLEWIWTHNLQLTWLAVQPLSHHMTVCLSYLTNNIWLEYSTCCVLQAGTVLSKELLWNLRCGIVFQGSELQS